MSPRLRTWIICAIGVILGLVAAEGIAEERYLVPGVLVISTFWLTAIWVRGATFDAWAVAMLLAGYLIGNRGFAQVSLHPSFPLLPAEAVLLIAVPALLVRMAYKQAAAIRRDGLNMAILAWLLLGLVRLPLDLREHGFLAMRDFAMVYYASFFFIAQALWLHPASQKLFLRVLTVAFALLPFVVLAYQVAPDFFLSQLVWRGIPLVFQKSDLSAAFLGGGFFWLWTRWEKNRKIAWLATACTSLVLIGTMASPRAAMVSVALVSLCWLVTGRLRIVVTEVVLLGVGAVALLFVTSVTNRNIRDSALYAVYEHATSIFDVRGEREYLYSRSGDPVDNNRFRLIWWASVVDETVQTNPVFGLGFGHDLAARFLANYEKVGAEDFTARSPHSMIVTVIGRMGFAGLLIWLVVAMFIARLVWRTFRGNDPDEMALVSVAVAIWISGCFGVVLEGPMGAVIFWTTLGFANAKSGENARAAAELALAAQEASPPPPREAVPEPTTAHP